MEDFYHCHWPLYDIMCQVMKNDKSWRGMLLKDNEGDWGVAVAAWRGMKKGQPGIPGNIQPQPQPIR